MTYVKLWFPGIGVGNSFFYFPYPFEKQENFRFKDGLFVRADELEGRHTAAGTVPVKKNDA